MTPTSSSAAKMSPALRWDEAQARKRMERAAKRLNPLGDSVLDTVLLTWNAIVDIDRLGRLENVNRELARVFGGGWQKSKMGLVIAWVVKTYQTIRAKSQHPLRKKTASRFKHLPVLGPTESLVKQVFRARGVNPKNVVNVMVYRHNHGGYSVHFTQLEPRRKQNDLARLAHIKHRGTIQDHGLCPTVAGLDIVTTQANGKKAVALRVSRKDFTTPGWAWDFYRHYLKPKTNTVALDLTFVSQLPGDLRHATSQLRRVLRSRQKAEGAIDYAEVSPISKEIKDAEEYAKRARVPRNTYRLMHSLNIQKCLCGAPIDLRLDPKTLTPTLRCTSCYECGTVMATGHVLATRASAYHLDNRMTYGHAGAPARI